MKPESTTSLGVGESKPVEATLESSAEKRRKSLQENNLDRTLTPAGQALAAAHFDFCTRIAIDYYRRHRRWAPFDDVLSEALMALCHAVCHFDADRGLAFATFAQVVIRRRLLKQSRQLAIDRKQLAAYRKEMRAAPIKTSAVRTELDLLPVRRLLPPRWYRVLCLHHCDQHPKRAIARQLGISPCQVARMIDESTKIIRRHYPDWQGLAV
ncbi:MAG: sigma-70 family RNA polymerase sigma factor [Zavarzinella sp.]